MKQSLIIILIICFALGESFTFIVKQDKRAEKATRLCCKELPCNQTKEPEKKAAAEQTELPGVHLLPFTL